MEDLLEYKGKWWLPGKEDDKVSGILTYIPGKTLVLELIGNFEDSAQDAIESLILGDVDERIPVIYGQDSNGSDISLFDCGNNIHRVFKADFPITKYHPRSIAIGIHIPSIEDKCFFKATVKIPELSYWLYPGTVEQQYLFDNDKITGVNVKMGRSPEEERTAAMTYLRNGYTISLVRDAMHNSDNFRFTTRFEQFTVLKLESKRESSLKSLYDIAVRYERFLSLSTLRNVYYSEFTLFSKSVFQTRGGKIAYIPVRFDTIFHGAPSDKKIESANFVFNYDCIKSKYDSVIRRWYFKDVMFDPIRSHALESIDYGGHFSYMNFLIVIQAIEGFGWRYRKADCKVTANKRVAKANKFGKPTGPKDITLADILKTLLNDYKDISCVNQKISISATTDSRNYYSHLTEKVKRHKLDGVKLFDLTQELRKLLLCCVYTYLGFTNSEIEQMTRNCNSSVFRGYK